MSVLFLVDVENGCQNFLKCDATSYTTNYDPMFKVEAFVQKGTEQTALKARFSSNTLTVHESMTNCPEAADVSLVIFAANLLLFRSQRSSDPLYKYSKIYIVKGGEKGYGELIARLKETFSDKFEEIDGRVKNICDFFEDIACVYCKKIFRSKYECQCHCNKTQCSQCKVSFVCSEEVKGNAEKHKRMKWKSCSGAGCDYSFLICGLMNSENQNHGDSHPKCTDESICGCDKYFMNAEVLKQHRTEKLQLQNSQFICECAERFLSIYELIVHCINTTHKCICPKCSVRLNVRNYDKHKPKCKN